MPKQHLFILYVGKVDYGETLARDAERRGWYAQVARDDLEALAMYVVYCPDIIYLDSTVDFAEEVDFHLKSVGASPILYLGDSHQPGGVVFPNVSDTEMLLDVALTVLREQWEKMTL